MISGLDASTLSAICDVLRQHPEVHTAVLFGSRAKGVHTERSDIDLALTGDVSDLRAAAIAAELEELPLPVRFDVQSLREITHAGLLEHIGRVGVRIYSSE